MSFDGSVDNQIPVMSTLSQACTQDPALLLGCKITHSCFEAVSINKSISSGNCDTWKFNKEVEGKFMELKITECHAIKSLSLICL